MSNASWLKYPSPLWITVQSVTLLIAISITSFIAALVSFLPLFYYIYRQLMSGSDTTDNSSVVPKSVFITGATSGIGEGLALRYAKEGVRYVYVTGRSQEKLDHTLSLLKAVNSPTKHPQFTPVTLNVDVTDVDGMRNALQTADDQCGGLDIVYANAGISPELIKHLPAEVVTRQTFDINITGVLNTIYPLYDRFIQRQGGHFVIISSIASYGPVASVAYSASKAAVTTFGQGLHRDLRPHNVNVTVICPGYIRSKITEGRHNEKGLPFFLETDVGVDIIYNAVKQKFGAFSFPFPMHAAAWLLRVLPFDIQDLFSHYVHKHVYRPIDVKKSDANGGDAATTTTTATKQKKTQ